MGGEGWLGGRHTAVAFNGRDQCGLLAAYKGTGAKAKFEVEGKVATKDIVAQQTKFSGLSYSDLEPMNRDGVLGADVDIALV